MLTRLPEFPDPIVAVIASGHVSASDYETVLVPAIEAALATHDKLRLLYEISDDFTGFSPGAMWEDMKLGMAHLRAWERAAVVTDVGWIANAVNVFRFVMPCEVKVFANRDRADAERWIRA